MSRSRPATSGAGAGTAALAFIVTSEPRASALAENGSSASCGRTASWHAASDGSARPRTRIIASPTAPNVVSRHFRVDQPNTVWAGDITYVWTEEGWLYLAVILDLFSRRVVGWAVDDTLDRRLALGALDRALEARRPALGLIHHSDRGSQYASQDYRAALCEHGPWSPA